MAKFQLIVSDPKTKTSRSVPLDGVRAQPLVGKGIGETVDARLLNLGSAILKLTGGTDKDGIPMRFDIQGTAKKRAILTGGVGFKSDQSGERRRKLVRGRVVGEDTMQVNSVVVEGQVSLPDVAQEPKAEEKTTGPSAAVKKLEEKAKGQQAAKKEGASK